MGSQVLGQVEQSNKFRTSDHFTAVKQLLQPGIDNTSDISQYNNI